MYIFVQTTCVLANFDIPALKKSKNEEIIKIPNNKQERNFVPKFCNWGRNDEI